MTSIQFGKSVSRIRGFSTMTKRALSTYQTGPPMRIQLPGLDTIGGLVEWVLSCQRRAKYEIWKRFIWLHWTVGLPERSDNSSEPTRSQQVNDSLLTRYQSLTSIQSPETSSPSSPLSSHHWFGTPSYQKQAQPSHKTPPCTLPSREYQFQS